MQAWKVGILNELVLVVRDPLAAIGAALKAVARKAGGAEPHEERQLDRSASLAFASAEVDRLNRALDDQMVMVALREELRRCDCAPVNLADLVDDLAAAPDGPGDLRRMLPGDLPSVSGDARLLASALRTLLQWLRRWSETGVLSIELREERHRVVGRLTVPGTWTSDPPSLDEASALSNFTGSAGSSALVLARLTFEELGGSLAFERQADLVGFAFALRVS